MKNFVIPILVVASALAVSAATSPSYINNSPITIFDRPPQVDAKVFVNRSTFEVVTALPYQAQNVQFWTNNAMMNGTPGFRFEQDGTGRIVTRRGRTIRLRAPSRRLQLPSTAFYNDGNITVASSLLVNATNIYNSGRFDGSEASKINLLATNGLADLARGGIRVGPVTGAGAACGFLPFGNTFTPDSAIVDQYWGAGRNDDLGTNGTPLNLPSLTNSSPFFFSSTYSLPNPRSPSHQVLQPSTGSSRVFTNTVVVPSFFATCGTNYDAFMHTALSTATSTVINVVFVPTRSLLAPDNLFVDVRFTSLSSLSGANRISYAPFVYAPVIEFRSVDFDIVDQQFATNYLTFIDTSSAQTNITLIRPTTLLGTRALGTRRPSTHTWFRGRYCSFDFSALPNADFDPSIFYNSLFQTNTANSIYAAGSVAVGAANSQTVLTQPLGVNPSLTDPTNFSGTVNIVAGQLNLDNSRIRATDFIGIHTANLISNTFAQLDAPFVDFNVRSTNTDLIISNVAPVTVNRIFGNISAYSSVWDARVTNAVSGVVETFRYHVTVVDNCLQSEQPVTMNRFFVGGTNLVIADRLSINSGLKIDARHLTIQRGGGLNLPLGANLAFTNVKQLLNLTNDGFLNVPASAFFGTFQAGHIVSNNVPALDNFVNRGSVSAASIFVRATNAQIAGAPFFPSSLTANGGVVGITASNVNVAAATLTASSDVEIHGFDVRLRESSISAGTPTLRGSLVIDATNSLTDGGTGANNNWTVTSGARLLRRPTAPGDLMGTRIISKANLFAQSLHIWAGENRGPVPAGFTNNLALARLTLDGALGTSFRFKSAGVSNSLYVDYLDLVNFPTNFTLASVLAVDPDFTLYFADSNIPAANLTNNTSGRVRWVSEFNGPISSTNITYPNGVTYTFNAGLVRSLDIDSDGDGLLNGEDCTPLSVPDYDSTLPCVPAPDLAVAAAMSTANIGLGITRSLDGQQVILSWNAAAGSDNTVEFADSAAAGSWQSLTNFINGPVDARVTVRDAVAAPLRVYRVRVDAGKP